MAKKLLGQRMMKNIRLGDKIAGAHWPGYNGEARYLKVSKIAVNGDKVAIHSGPLKIEGPATNKVSVAA